MSYKLGQAYEKNRESEAALKVGHVMLLLEPRV